MNRHAYFLAAVTISVLGCNRAPTDGIPLNSETATLSEEAQMPLSERTHVGQSLQLRAIIPGSIRLPLLSYSPDGSRLAAVTVDPNDVAIMNLASRTIASVRDIIGYDEDGSLNAVVWTSETSVRVIDTRLGAVDKTRFEQGESVPIPFFKRVIDVNDGIVGESSAVTENDGTPFSYTDATHAYSYRDSGFDVFNPMTGATDRVLELPSEEAVLWCTNQNPVILTTSGSGVDRVLRAYDLRTASIQYLGSWSLTTPWLLEAVAKLPG